MGNEKSNMSDEEYNSLVSDILEKRRLWREKREEEDMVRRFKNSTIGIDVVDEMTKILTDEIDKDIIKNIIALGDVVDEINVDTNIDSGNVKVDVDVDVVDIKPKSQTSNINIPIKIEPWVDIFDDSDEEK